MNPEFAEAMLRVLNINAEMMAKHIATGQTVILQPLPNPLDYYQPQGEEMNVLDRSEPVEGPTRPVRVQDLVVTEHRLSINVSLSYVMPGELSDATRTMISDELNEHIAQALRQRNLAVTSIDEWDVSLSEVEVES